MHRYNNVVRFPLRMLETVPEEIGDSTKWSSAVPWVQNAHYPPHHAGKFARCEVMCEWVGVPFCHLCTSFPGNDSVRIRDLGGLALICLKPPNVSKFLFLKKLLF